MTVISSSIASSNSSSYVPAARSGIDTVSKDIKNAQAEKNTAVEDQEIRYVDEAGQKAKIDQLEKKIEDKEAEAQKGRKSEEELSRLEQQIADLIDRFSKNPTNIKFSHSETTSGQVIDVIDTETEEKIRQIPSEEALAIRERLHELSEMYTHSKGKGESDYDAKAKSILLDTSV